MEPDIPPSSSPPPPPLMGEGDADGEVGSEEDGEFGHFSVGASPSDPSSAPTSVTFSHAVKRSQPASSVNRETNQEVEAAQSCVQFTNGFTEGEQNSEESGFADFSVFIGQSAHPWCCGFSPTVDTVNQQTSHSGPRSHSTGEEPLSTGMENTVESSQDGPQPQEYPAVKGFSSNEEAGNTAGERVMRSPSEELPSSSEDVSLDRASSETEPNVSSLNSLNDWDATDEDDETPNVGQSEHNTQESDANTRSTDDTLKKQNERDEAAESGVLTLGNLPPSDSFADFCSAPAHTDAGEGWWAEFKEQSQPNVEGNSWTQSKQPISRLQEEEEDEGWKPSSSESSQSSRVEQLLQSSFPGVHLPAEEEEEELLSLEALLHSQHRSEEEQEETLSGAQRIQQEMLWRRSEDSLGAVGLRFQWGGSRVNRTLLSSLGVDARNIVFMGNKKQPVTVPAFVSGLGLLEPTKDSVTAGCSPIRTTVSTHTPKDKQGPSTHSMQEELPRSPLDWSRRGLSSAQDGTSPRRAPHFWGWK